MSTLYATSAASQRNARPDEPQTRRTPPNATYQHSKPPASFIPTSDCTSPASLTIHGPVEEKPPPLGISTSNNNNSCDTDYAGFRRWRFIMTSPRLSRPKTASWGHPTYNQRVPGPHPNSTCHGRSFDTYGRQGREQCGRTVFLKRGGRQYLPARANVEKQQSGGALWILRIGWKKRVLYVMYGGFCSVALPDCERYVRTST